MQMQHAFFFFSKKTCSHAKSQELAGNCPPCNEITMIWLAGWLAGWLDGWLAGWLTVWMAGFLDGLRR